MVTKNIDTRKKWLTATEAAQLAGKSRQTIYNWASAGFVWVDDRKRYRRDDIEKKAGFK